MRTWHMNQRTNQNITHRQGNHMTKQGPWLISKIKDMKTWTWNTTHVTVISSQTTQEMRNLLTIWNGSLLLVTIDSILIDLSNCLNLSIWHKIKQIQLTRWWIEKKKILGHFYLYKAMYESSNQFQGANITPFIE